MEENLPPKNFVKFKPEPLGDCLTNYELRLYEYTALGVCEEIDVYYCKQQQKLPEFATKNALKQKIQSLLEYSE